MHHVPLTTLLFSFLTVVAAHSQGSLTPPAGGPAPMMKTLDQIEARIPIPKSTAVLAAGPHYTITQPGSYYLTGNIEVASGDGIVINSGNVTLDLNGFALISKTVFPASGNAINFGTNVTGVIIKNGTITGGATRTPSGGNPWEATFANKGWTYGILDTFANPAFGVQVMDLAVRSCISGGIWLYGSSTLHNVTATANGDDGIHLTNGVVSHSSAIQNRDIGISVSNGSVTNCLVMHNEDSGINCNEGVVSNSTAKANGESGIEALNGVVSECRSTANFEQGIYVAGGVAAHCVASGNSTDPTTTHKNIEVTVGGQRVGCVPASE